MNEAEQKLYYETYEDTSKKLLMKSIKEAIYKIEKKAYGNAIYRALEEPLVKDIKKKLKNKHER